MQQLLSKGAQGKHPNHSPTHGESVSAHNSVDAKQQLALQISRIKEYLREEALLWAENTLKVSTGKHLIAAKSCRSERRQSEKHAGPHALRLRLVGFAERLHRDNTVFL